MDYINRADFERKLARVVGRGLSSELDKLLAYLGDPPDLNNVPTDYWQNGWRTIQRDVEPILIDAFLGQAEGMMLNVGIGINLDRVNRRAVDWARLHTDNLLTEMWRARQREVADGVGTIIAQGYEEGLTIRQISERMERLYSPVRAEMIAITETTRAVVEGERAYVEMLMAETGIQMVPIWMTANDDLVCPICEPRNEKPITNGEYPPAHPRCRCGVGWDFAEVAQNV